MRLSVFLACALVAPVLMAAAQPMRLQPSSQWVVDYAADSCRLVRNFGVGKDETKFALESESPGEVDMLVVGNPLANNTEEVSARFLPVQVKPMTGRTAIAEDRRPALLWSQVIFLPDDLAEKKKKSDEARHKTTGRPPALDLAEEARTKAMRQDFASKANELEINTHRGRPVVLEAGPLGEAMKAFDKCGRDSLRDWGVDPDLEDKIVRPLWTPSVAKWFSASDYPQRMLVLEQESVVKVRLLVDARGRPTKCTSLSHFKESSFNDVVCAKFMDRAHFEPAELADGTKVPSFYTTVITFMMGD